MGRIKSKYQTSISYRNNLTWRSHEASLECHVSSEAITISQTQYLGKSQHLKNHKHLFNHFDKHFIKKSNLCWLLKIMWIIRRVQFVSKISKIPEKINFLKIKTYLKNLNENRTIYKTSFYLFKCNITGRYTTY